MGPSERELNRAVARYAVWIRSAVVALCGALGIFAEQTVATAALVTLALGWCVAQVLRPRHPAALDVVVVLAVGMSQMWTGPQPVSSWVFALLAITNITGQFEWGPRPLIAGMLSTSSIGVYVAGNVLAGPDDGVVSLGVRMLVEAVLARVGYVLIRSRARAADRAAERAAALRRDAEVAAARRGSEREYLATLHDTASATLLMVSVGVNGDGPAWLPDRARRDLEMLATVPGADFSRVDLAALLAPLTGLAGIRIEAEIRGPLVLPAGPALGILHGVREAVTNVERHGAVTEATLCAGRDEAGRIVVELRDRGRGFRPEEIPVHRRGISGSIRTRMEDNGGRATVDSAPGEGTTVSWVWPSD